MLLVGSAMTAHPAAGQVEGPASEVEAREIAFAKTMADRDFDAFLSFVSPEAIFFNGNEALRGRDAIGQAWAAFFEDSVARARGIRRDGRSIQLHLAQRP
jgi:ketosteroid isomerase-like protein